MKVTYEQLKQINIKMEALSVELKKQLNKSNNTLHDPLSSLHELMEVYLSEDKGLFKWDDDSDLIHQCKKWHDPECLKNVNSLTYLPGNITKENAWSSERIRDYKIIFSKFFADKIPPLAYVGKLASFIPDVNIDGFDLSKLSDIADLIKSVETYVYIRIRLGADKMDQIDPDRKLHLSLRDVVTHTMNFIERLSYQRKEIFNGLMKLYQETFNGITGAIEGSLDLRHDWDTRLNILSANKVMLMHYTRLLQPSIHIGSLWYGADFQSDILKGKIGAGQIAIDKVKKEINAIPSNTLAKTTLYETLLTCQKLLDAVIYHEDLQFLPSLDEEDLMLAQPIISADLEPQEQETIIPMIDKTLIDDLEPAIPEEIITFDHNRIDEDLLHILGDGNTGEVFLSNDLKANKPIAIKYFYPDISLSDDIKRSLSSIALREHPCEFLVRVLGLYELDQTHGIVTEFVPSGTLSNALHEKDEPLDWNERESVSREIIAGLLYLHANNIIHGNLKTQNILIAANNHAKISDYGLNIPHQVSLPYRAPEQVNDTGKYSTKETDVYSLGVILWEILTSKIPFDQLDDFGIRSYWNAMIDEPEEDNHFIMPIPDPTLPKMVHRTYTFLAPIVKACRQIDPEVRPTLDQLKQSNQPTLNRL